MTSLTYLAYLLRLWRTTGGQWRASLETTQTGERLAFATLAELAAFLARETNDKPPDSPEKGDPHAARL